MKEEEDEQPVQHVCQQRQCPCERPIKEKLKNKHSAYCLSCEKMFTSFSRYEKICRRCKLDERFKWSS